MVDSWDANGGAQAWVGEGIGPSGERFVGGDVDGVLLFSFGEDLKEQFCAAAVQFHVTEFVDAEQIHATVAGDGFGEDFLVGGFDEFAHEPGGQSVFDPVALLGRRGVEPYEQVGLPVPESLMRH